MVFDWTLAICDQIKKQRSIGEFTFGLINKCNNVEKGHAFDVKKIQSLADVETYPKIWSGILLNEKPSASTKL